MRPAGRSLSFPPWHFDKQVDYQDIYTEGITKITTADIRYAKALGMTIKLLAYSRKLEGHYFAMVAPFLLGPNDPLYSVNGVFNAIFVHGNVLGDAMFYGSGAGKLPTASAVVADVVDEVMHQGETIPVYWGEEKLTLDDLNDSRRRFLVRVKGDAASDLQLWKLFSAMLIRCPFRSLPENLLLSPA